MSQSNPHFADGGCDLPLGPHSVGEGEFVSGWVERAAALHGIHVYEIFGLARDVTGVSTRTEAIDFSAPESWLRALESAARLQRGSLQLMPRKDEHRYRPYGDAYCPLCFAGDLAAGQLPYRRSVWQLVSLTGCAIHECPLIDWPAVRDDQWVYPSDWIDQVCGLNLTDPGYLRRERRHRERKAPDFSFVDHHVTFARLFAGGLAPFHQFNFKLEKLLTEWRSQLLFELELAGLRPVRVSVLRELGSGTSFEPFVQDLYALLTTRFRRYGSRFDTPCEMIDLEAPFTEIYGRWVRTWPARSWYEEFQPKDWRYAPSVRELRFVLRTARRILESHFSPLASSKRTFASRVLTLGLTLAEYEGAEWFSGRFRKWPPRLREEIPALLTQWR